MLNNDSTIIDNWLDVYRNNFIQESNVLVYKLETASTLTLLFDKEHISKYTYQSHNAWVGKDYPSEEHTIEIRNWDSLSATTKNFLSTKGNILHFKYYVKKDVNTTGVESERARFGVIYDVKRDVKTGTRTIYCRSILSLLTSKASYQLNKTPSEIITAMGSKQEYTDAGISYYIPSGLASITKQIDRLPANITDGELLQNLALALGRFIRACVSSTSEKTPKFTIWNTLTSTNYRFPNINIKEHSLNEYKATESTTIEILGSKLEPTPTNVGSVSYTTSSSVMTTIYLTNYYPTDCKINNITAQTSGGVSTPITISSRYNDYVVGRIQNPSANATYEMTAYANKLITEQSQTSGTTTISCMLLGGNISKDDYLSTKATTYYGYNTMIEFDCRINPNFECGDTLAMETLFHFIDDDTYIIEYKVVIEELSITFNGAFNGHIKGRKTLL